MSQRLPNEEYKRLCRDVMERDGWKCRNPLCGARNGLHIHHIIFRSEQGPDESWNLCVLCHKCHDALHRYEFRIGKDERMPEGHPEYGADGILIFHCNRWVFNSPVDRSHRERLRYKPEG